MASGLRCVTSAPPRRIVPDVGSRSFITTLPRVDLPQPDSPTTPSVSPRLTSKLTPSTARTMFFCRLNRPPPTGKCLTRCRTSRLGAALTRRLDDAVRMPACRDVAGALLEERRGLGGAELGREGAAGREGTAWDGRRQHRDDTRDLGEPRAP